MDRPRQKPRVLISNLGSDRNKGDSAILESVIARVRETWPGADLRLVSAFAWTDPHFASEYAHTRGLAAEGSILGSVFPIVPPGLVNAPRAIAYTLRAAAFACRLPLPRWFWSPDERQTLEIFRRADLLISNGGGFVFGEKGLRGTVRLFRVLFACVTAAVYRVPFVLYGQSFGPFAGRLQVWLARRVLDRAAAVLAREVTSAATLRRIGVRAPFKAIPDPAFGLEAAGAAEARAVLERFGVPAGRPLVGLTVRDWHFAHRYGSDGQAVGLDNYLRSMAEAIDRLHKEAGTHAVLWPQCTGFRHFEDDRIISRRLREATRHPEAVTLVDEELAPGLLKACYGLMDLFIATRFHSAIFALTEGVPTLSISYWGPKAEGIMAGLGLEDCLFSIDALRPEQLAEAALSLWGRRDEMRAYLAAKLPPVVAEARRLDPWVAGLIPRAGDGSQAGDADHADRTQGVS